MRMTSCFCRSSYALLIAAFSTEAYYCSRAAQRSNLWTSHQPAFATITPPNNPYIHTRDHTEHKQGASTELRAGGTKTESTAAADDRFWNKQLARELFAKMIGTAMVVGLGTGAVMSAIFTGSLVGLFQIASVWIIAVTLAIATTGPVSGAHLNPAISASFALLRPSQSFGWPKVIPYCAAQLVGAILGSFTNLFLYASKIREFEEIHAIARGTAESIASAKAFGQYFE